jgi:hypothetical protein
MAWSMASSKPSLETALISVTLATRMVESHPFRTLLLIYMIGYHLGREAKPSEEFIVPAHPRRVDLERPVPLLSARVHNPTSTHPGEQGQREGLGLLRTPAPLISGSVSNAPTEFAQVA